jgi:hypothetical protein
VCVHGLSAVGTLLARRFPANAQGSRPAVAGAQKRKFALQRTTRLDNSLWQIYSDPSINGTSALIEAVWMVAAAACSADGSLPLTAG